MKFSVTSGNPKDQPGDCIVIGVFQNEALSGNAVVINDASGGYIKSIIDQGDMEGKKGQTLLLHKVVGIQAVRVLLVGLGEAKELNEQGFRDAALAAARVLNKTAATKIVSCLTDIPLGDHDTRWKIRQTVEMTGDAAYRFDQLKSKTTPPSHPIESMSFLVDSGDAAAAEHAIAEGSAIILGKQLARDLGNLPGNICTPTYLAEQGKALEEQYGINTTVLEEKDMEALGMGALLSVSRGSRQPAKLICMEYSGGKKDSAPVILVGKGLTFDAGGISLKPAAAMDEMKYDMCGGASVLGVMKAICELKLPLNVVGLIPSSENLPDGEANKPGDIVTSMSGQTIEILNTDAEGRLILCDALTYAERYNPAVVIDIATLTGACVVALGKHASGLLGNDEELTRDLIQAGRVAFDRAWELPLWPEYDKQLESNFADMANIGGRDAGTITAACFLARYTKKFKWAHLDIAGTAWLSGKSKGATGRPVPLLMQYLIDRSKKK